MVTGAGGRGELHAKIELLNDAQVVVVARFVDAVTGATDVELLETSWFATSIWAEDFTARLRAYHANAEDPLSSTAFEAVFVGACRTAGWEVDRAASATHRFFDVTLVRPGAAARTLSLKASSAKDMTRQTVHISKLTEAAWIQDARRARDRKPLTVQLFDDYRAATSSILMLRAFRSSSPPMLEYQLLEIPTEIFARVAGVSTLDFQGGTVPVRGLTGEVDFKIRLDRSDAKITLTGIRLGVCTVHGSWKLPTEGR